GARATRYSAGGHPVIGSAGSVVSMAEPTTTPRVGAAVGRIALMTLTAVSLYVFAPSLVEVYSSWDTLVTIEPWWLAAIFGAQFLSFLCIWWLQTIVLRTHGWFPVVTSQLAGNAFSRVVPGGAAAGVALQMRMLTKGGV